MKMTQMKNRPSLKPGPLPNDLARSRYNDEGDNDVDLSDKGRMRPQPGRPMIFSVA